MNADTQPCSQVTYAAALMKTIRETGRVRMEVETKRLAAEPLQRLVEEKTELIQTLKEEMSELRTELTASEQELEESKKTLLNQLKIAKAASGVEPGSKDRPPKALRDFWDKVG